MIEIFAPAGIGEVTAGSDLVAVVAEAVAADPSGPLHDGDIVVVTSKIVSKAEGRTADAADYLATVAAEAEQTVARRGPVWIVRTRHGLTLAGAGVDNSNVDPGTVLLLPADPDRSAAALRVGLQRRTGRRLGVVISDTAGRAWRIGQTDQAIGASGIRVVERYAGRVDRYGNELQVTAVAIADEVASAADLVKGKLRDRPVAVVRGLPEHVLDDARPGSDQTAGSDQGAVELVREPALDLFGHGTREAVIAAVLTALGQSDRFETVAALDDDAVVAEVRAAAGGSGPATEILTKVVRAGLPTAGADVRPSEASELPRP